MSGRSASRWSSPSVRRLPPQLAPAVLGAFSAVGLVAEGLTKLSKRYAQSTVGGSLCGWPTYEWLLVTTNSSRKISRRAKMDAEMVPPPGRASPARVGHGEIEAGARPVAAPERDRCGESPHRPDRAAEDESASPSSGGRGLARRAASNCPEGPPRCLASALDRLEVRRSAGGPPRRSRLLGGGSAVHHARTLGVDRRSEQAPGRPSRQRRVTRAGGGTCRVRASGVEIVDGVWQSFSARRCRGRPVYLTPLDGPPRRHGPDLRPVDGYLGPSAPRRLPAAGRANRRAIPPRPAERRESALGELPTLIGPLKALLRKAATGCAERERNRGLTTADTERRPVLQSRSGREEIFAVTILQTRGASTLATFSRYSARSASEASRPADGRAARRTRRPHAQSDPVPSASDTFARHLRLRRARIAARRARESKGEDANSSPP